MVRERMNKAGANSHPVPLFTCDYLYLYAPKIRKNTKNKKNSIFFKKIGKTFGN